MTIGNSYAVQFNGNTNSYIDCGIRSMDIRTVEMYVNFNSIGGTRQIFFHKGTTSNASKDNFEIEVDTNGKVRIFLGDGNTYITFTSNRVLSANKTYHIAVVIEQSAKKIYIDGALDISYASPILPKSTAEQVTIGKSIMNGYNLPMKGMIDEVRVWSITRTQQEINYYKNRRLLGNETGLIMYYRLDEGNGNVIYDSSSSQFNGTLYNSSWINGLVDLLNANFLINVSSEIISKSNDYIKYLPDASEKNFISHGIDINAEINLNEEMTKKSFIKQSYDILGGGRVFKQIIDTSKISIKQVIIE